MILPNVYLARFGENIFPKFLPYDITATSLELDLKILEIVHWCYFEIYPHYRLFMSFIVTEKSK